MTDVTDVHMFCVTLVVLYVSTILCVGSPVFDLIREAHFSLFNEPGEIVRTPERRRNALEIWASIFARITEIYSILFLCLRMAYLEHFSTPPWKDLHFGGLLVISLAMRCPGRLGVSRLWQSRVMIVLSFVASSMIRVHVPKAMAPTNTLACTMVGLFSDDPWFAIWTRLFFAPVGILADCSRDGHGASELILIIVNEICCCLYSSFMLLQVHSLLYKREVFAMKLEDELRKSQGHMSALQRLLSVTCDCCEELAQNWEILWPSRAIWDLLRLPGSWQDRASQTTLPFLDFVCQEDHQRFADFTGQSHHSPPSTLHLRMKDASGNPFDAQIYHVNIDGDRSATKSKHLIGISLLHPTFDSTSLMDNANGDQSPNSEANGPNGIAGARRNFLSAIKTMSLVLDLGTEGNEVCYGVRSLEMIFEQKASGLPLPRLFHWLAEEDKAKVEDWIQEHANAWYRQDMCCESCSEIQFQIPGFANLRVGEMSAEGIACVEKADESGSLNQNHGFEPGRIVAPSAEYQLFMRIDMKTLQMEAPCIRV